MSEDPRNQKTQVQYVTITEDEAGQRIDNFLITKFKTIPKSHVYKMLRKGEVRVNKKRINAFYRLMEEDSVRLPPVYREEEAKQVPPTKSTEALLLERILYEDEFLLIINKPCGMAVHGGSTIRVGVVEALRHMYPQYPQLELGHRLDSDTSGCLVLAKKKRILRELHTLLRQGQVNKIYWALTKGRWEKSELRVDQPLQKEFLMGGKHVVQVSKEGKPSLTVFKPLKVIKNATLVEVKLHTGRTHQIRVHAQYQGHPIAGDDRYGDLEFNKFVRKNGLKRLFLHARSIDFTLPSLPSRIKVVAPLDPELEACIKILEENQ